MLEENRLAPWKRLADVRRKPPSALEALGGYSKQIFYFNQNSKSAISPFLIFKIHSIAHPKIFLYPLSG